MKIENKRLSNLYKSSIVRALFLDYVVQNIGKSISVRDFVKDHNYENDLWFELTMADMNKELTFLENLGLIERSSEGALILTEKGFESVAKGIYWDRMKSLTLDVRLFRNQLIVIVIASLSAILSGIMLIIKLMEG